MAFINLGNSSDPERLKFKKGTDIFIDD